MDKLIRVLWYSDTPCCNTGFGNVARNILSRLQATGKYRFEIQGINHWDDYDHDLYPYWRIHPAGSNPEHDMFGKSNLAKLIMKGGFDIFFSLQDLNLMASFAPVVHKSRDRNQFRWIAYSPLDAPWVNRALLASYYEAEYPVCYTQFAHDVISEVDERGLAHKMNIVYHGTEPESFYPLGPDERAELRKKHFGIEEDTFLVLNLNRNQWRKDLARTMWGFRLWKDLYGHKARLYIHAKPQDAGGNLLWQAANAGLDLKRDIFFAPDDFSTFTGFPTSTVNEIYNCADVLVSTTLGEGWGFSCTEAFCTKTPVLMPRNSSLVEMVGPNEERGWLADSGSNPSLWTVGYGESDTRRPLVDICSFADKLEAIYQGEEVHDKVEAAYAWAQEHTWDIICRQWERIFEEAMR